MLDQVVLFSKAGVVLWSKSWAKIRDTVGGESPVSALVRTVLLEDKGGATNSATVEQYQLKWTFANEFDLVIVVVYQKLLQCLYAEELLEALKAAFLKHFAKDFKAKGSLALPNFEPHFEKALRKATTKLKDAKAAAKANQPDRSKRQSQRERRSDGGDEDEDDGDGDEGGEGHGSAAEAVAQGGEAAMMSARARLRARAAKNKAAGKGGGSGTGGASSGGGMKKGGSKKEATVWRDGTSASKKLSKAAAAELDFSKRKSQRESGGGGEEDEEEEEEALRLKEYQDKYLPDAGETPEWADDSDDDSDDGAEEGGGVGGWFGRSAVGSFLKTVTGNKVLEESDLSPVLENLKHQLLAKNVAQDVASNICATVRSSLEGQRLGSLTMGVGSTVRGALKAAVLRVLTPPKATDLLHAVRSHKGSGRPFVVCFVGINGVGKSTSLAKVAYYLKQQGGCKVLLAACDTFRSGAVEQLRAHAKCLDVPLFERGYLKDPGEVARMAIAEAQATNCDAVLVDTAGRMQNNDKLMRELAKLVAVNRPELLLFVGEALVGNDGIDQLRMFNRALATHLPSGLKGKGIDGIVLTKFDTIDDKVGAALSMSYQTGQPVMFVGTGQKYTHLKKLNVNAVVKSLFS